MRRRETRAKVLQYQPISPTSVQKACVCVNFGYLSNSSLMVFIALFILAYK